MQRSRTIIFNICFGVNCLLVFLLFLEDRMVLPSWLQVAGRMHPLVLHFPITLLILSIFWALFVEKRVLPPLSANKFGDWLLLVSAFAASVTALMGLFLSKEAGYDTEALQWHKWAGIGVSVFTCLWYAYRETIKKISVLNISAAVFCLAAVIAAGHLGAGITHGQDYLLAPMLQQEQRPKVLFEEAEVYAHMVKPILQNRCMNCHNSKKAKGELIMETEETLLKGGKNGKLWDSTETDYGLLLQRIHLPLETKKHMPPQGKPQLTEQEKQILDAWVKGGADFTVKVMDLPPADTLRLIAMNLFNTVESDTYEFAAADEEKVQKLNTNYRVVQPLAIESPALAVEFFNAQFYKPDQLKELLAVKDQVVSLNLNKMPVRDEELNTIGQFKNLRKLNLSFTAITGSTLHELGALNELKQLSLSGTPVKASDILQLLSLKKLTHLYVWHTALEQPAVEKLKQSWKGLAIETGYYGDTTVLKLTPPILQNDEQVISEPVALKLKHYINGVSIRYTLDGTEPDSVNSPEYQGNVELSKNVTVKAKAFKPGWISSDVMESHFYSAGHKADSVVNILPPDAQYKGDGAGTLTDLEKGEVNNFRSGKWLGFRDNKMEAMLIFNSPVTVSSVTLSTLIDIGGYIMPPASIEIWGGDNPKKLRLLNRLVPKQPFKTEPAYLKAFDCSFKAVSLKYVKVITVPVAKLPSWHPAKGDKGWLFTDEVFVN